MKAKEWFAKIIECKSEKEVLDMVSKCLIDFIHDADKLIKIRKAKSDTSVASCVNEVNNKWIALINLVENNKLDKSHPINKVTFLKDGFKAAYVQIHPNKGWYFDIKHHRENIKLIEDKNEAVTIQIPVLAMLGLTSYPELENASIEELQKELLASFLALGSIYGTHPFSHCIAVSNHITLLKKWINDGKVDLNDIDHRTTHPFEGYEGDMKDK